MDQERRRKRCKVIGILNQKGGVVKTSTCRNLATILKDEGYKVLVVDCDNQASLTDIQERKDPEYFLALDNQ